MVAASGASARDGVTPGAGEGFNKVCVTTARAGVFSTN